MSGNGEVVDYDTDADVQSYYSGDESSEDVLASFWRQYSIKYQPVYALKVKNRYASLTWLQAQLFQLGKFDLFTLHLTTHLQLN